MIKELSNGVQGLLISKLGINSKVASGLVSKAATMILGPIGSAIIVLKLDAETQGIYYLFLSIVALKGFFELGVGMSITQIAAHEKMTVNGQAELHPSMILATNAWLKIASIAFGLIVGVGGAIFLIVKGYTQFSILGAWCLYIAVSALRFAFDGVWSMLTGADYVKESNYLLIKLQMILYFIQWTLLLLGAGLYAFAISSLVIYFIQIRLVQVKFPWLFPKKNSASDVEVSKKSKDLLKLLKRSGQTFMTGYFVYQIQQPICFHLLGPVASAKLGLTQVIGMAFLTLPIIWIQSSFPSIASSVGSGKIVEGWMKYKTELIRAISLTVFCLVGAILALEIIRLLPRFGDRLMETKSATIFFAGLGVQTVASGITYWPRSFKIEPFVSIAYIQMIATPLLLWLLISRWGLAGVSIATLSTWSIGLFGISYISIRYMPSATKN